jgi:hypothetical protein
MMDVNDECGAVYAMRIGRENQSENLAQCHTVHHKSHMT